MSWSGRADALLMLLREAAEAGQVCPSNVELAAALECSEPTLTGLLGRLVQGRVLVVALVNNGRVVGAADFSWITATPPPRSGTPGRRSGLPQRKCLRCGLLFQPPHRGRFLHDTCNAINARAIA